MELACSGRMPRLLAPGAADQGQRPVRQGEQHPGRRRRRTSQRKAAGRGAAEDSLCMRRAWQDLVATSPVQTHPRELLPLPGAAFLRGRLPGSCKGHRQGGHPPPRNQQRAARHRSSRKSWSAQPGKVPQREPLLLARLPAVLPIITCAGSLKPEHTAAPRCLPFHKPLWGLLEQAWRGTEEQRRALSRQEERTLHHQASKAPGSRSGGTRACSRTPPLPPSAAAAASASDARLLLKGCKGHCRPRQRTAPSPLPLHRIAKACERASRCTERTVRCCPGRSNGHSVARHHCARPAGLPERMPGRAIPTCCLQQPGSTAACAKPSGSCPPCFACGKRRLPADGPQGGSSTPWHRPAGKAAARRDAARVLQTHRTCHTQHASSSMHATARVLLLWQVVRF